VKLDPSGSFLWAKGFGGAGFEQNISVAVDGAGSVAIVSWFDQSIDFGGGAIASAGGIDVAAAKLDADGEHIWSRGFGGPDNQYSFGIAADAAGNVVVGGSFSESVDLGQGQVASAGSRDIFIVKLDTAGVPVWSRHLGDQRLQEVLDVAIDDAGRVLVTGEYEGVLDFGDGALDEAPVGDVNAFVAKLSATGETLWSEGLGEPVVNQWGTGVASDGAGNVLVTGFFEGTVDFGGIPLMSAGSSDVFVVKLEP
jgi:hypothetical protein